MTAEALREARLGDGGPLQRTQVEYAAALGVTSNTVARWERGELSIPRWVDQMIAVMRDLEATQRELQRERARNDRLKECHGKKKAERKRAVTRLRS
jgi:transcriptional regulator with XRE-family HTH domain